MIKMSGNSTPTNAGFGELFVKTMGFGIGKMTVIGILVTMQLFSPISLTPVISKEKKIILQSTTSTQNSGLLDYLLPKFTAKTGIDVHVVAVGTGQALKNGRNGDGDVLLVHAKIDEEFFVKMRHGIARFDVMFNDFVLVGPIGDPAKIRDENNIAKALRAISRNNALFISRGDNSGTNKKELLLWRKAKVDINGMEDNWYRETGSGMGATLNIAAGMGAYTLSDRATWLSFANRQDLSILSEGDPLLFNQYGVILVNPKTHSDTNLEYGKLFVQWLTGEEGQSAIGSYKLDGEQLFFPNAQP